MSVLGPSARWSRCCAGSSAAGPCGAARRHSRHAVTPRASRVPPRRRRPRGRRSRRTCPSWRTPARTGPRLPVGPGTTAAATACAIGPSVRMASIVDHRDIGRVSSECFGDHGSVDAEQHRAAQPGAMRDDQVVERRALGLTAGDPDHRRRRPAAPRRRRAGWWPWSRRRSGPRRVPPPSRSCARRADPRRPSRTAVGRHPVRAGPARPPPARWRRCGGGGTGSTSRDSGAARGPSRDAAR